MQDKEQRMSAALVRIFENVLLTEELSLSQGYFSDLSIAEMHTLTAIGPYEAKTMTNTAAILGITTGTLTVAIDRMLPEIETGDILYIHDAGGHGYAMGYNYNGRLKSAEVLLTESGEAKLIRRAETLNDYFATLDGTEFADKLLSK